MLIPSRKKGPSGFALVITLSLMILLVVIAVGLLSLSTVSLRSSSQASAASTARENARLGMMMALGELQKSLGTDTSVTADAAAMTGAPNRPHLTGVWQRAQQSSQWKDWHWNPAKTGSPNYSGKSAAFKGWLISTANVGDSKNPKLPETALQPSDTVVTLVGDTKSPLPNYSTSNIVNAQKVKLGPSGKLGAYAWSAFDESAKAPIHLEDPANKQDRGEEIASRYAPSRVRGDVVNSKLETALRTPDNLISMDTAVIPGGSGSRDEIRRRFHDFTTDSKGLLTDTANGGMKVDLTTLFEEGAGTANPLGAFKRSGPYPDDFTPANGAPTWTYLRDVYRKYKAMSEVTRGATSLGLGYKPDDGTNPDMTINPDGLNVSPDSQRMLPVIAKLQLAFSIVTHHEHLDNRTQWYDDKGDPKGNDNYGVVHLACDPIVTLYNPYDVALDLDKLRVRIWDPPVGFRFRKKDMRKGSDVFFRPADSGFLSLARFQNDNENNPKARKAFTLILSNGTNAESSKDLKLLPGEVKVYSPRVEDHWNWKLETSGGLNPYAFFDHAAGSNFGNVDHRSPNGLGAFGIESVPGWNGQAGLSLDHLANGGRPESTLYDFERGGPVGGYVALRLDDEVVVEFQPMVANPNLGRTFQVDILAGVQTGKVTVEDLNSDDLNAGVSEDRLRSYIFNLADVTKELPAPGEKFDPRTYRAGDILQKPEEPKIPGTNVNGPGGKKPFAMLEMSARTTKDSTTDSKVWLYNNPVTEGGLQNTGEVGLTNQSYDLRLYSLSGGFKGFPNGIDIDPTTYRGYFGASASADRGSSFVPMVHVPVSPMASLGEMVHSNLVSGSNLPRVVHPFGNSRSHPLITPQSIYSSAGTGYIDHSYLLNDSLWDSYYFSSLTGYGKSNGSSQLGQRSRSMVLEQLIDGGRLAVNNRISPIQGSGDAKDLAAEIDGTSAVQLSRKLGTYFGVTGPFNLNSTSVDAWRAVLSSLRDRQISGGNITGWAFADAAYPNESETPFSRSGKPLNGSIKSNAVANNMRWAGFRALSDQQIDTLAQSIVQQIKARIQKDGAPAFSLGEFVNRRIGAAGDIHSLGGLLQTAIDNSKINDDFRNLDGKSLTSFSIGASRKKGAVNTDAMIGYTSEGAPSMVTQGDLMSALAPIATVRGDTFKIRSYGEAVDGTGTRVTARAWCEVVVQRVPEYVDPTDAADKEVEGSGGGSSGSALSAVNQTFGRKFNIVSFRWLNENEI